MNAPSNFKSNSTNENPHAHGKRTLTVLGSQGQMKNEVSPLLPHYDKAQRTLLMQLEALGLNYSTTPSKVKEDTRKGVSENDTLTNTLAATREEMNNPDGFIIPEG